MSEPKTFLFAGASSKIAIETAKLLKQQNHNVIGISTKENIEGYNAFYKVEEYNFNTFPEIKEVLNGLVYFPGSINLKPFHRLSEQDFLTDYHINALGAAAFAQKYVSNLKNAQNPSMVFISSVAATTGLPFHASIAMAKAAIEGLTRALAAELAPTIRVNCVAPSLTSTPLADKLINTPEKLEASQKRNPLKKVGDAINVANAIEFLLSDKASWVTAQVLAVDGGMKHLKI